jgi:hypothetical protein
VGDIQVNLLKSIIGPYCSVKLHAGLSKECHQRGMVLQEGLMEEEKKKKYPCE